MGSPPPGAKPVEGLQLKVHLSYRLNSNPMRWVFYRSGSRTPASLTKQLWTRRWILLTWCRGAALLSDYSGARRFCGCHMWSLVWCLYTVPQQWPPATPNTWPKLQPHGQVACVYSNFIPVCLSIIPRTQSGVHQGQGQTVFSPLSLPCPETTGHNSRLSSTTSLLSGLPLQVAADNLLELCYISFLFVLFSICTAKCRNSVAPDPEACHNWLYLCLILKIVYLKLSSPDFRIQPPQVCIIILYQ